MNKKINGSQKTGGVIVYLLPKHRKKKNTVSVTPVKKIKQFKVEYGDYTTSFQMFFKLVGKEKNTTLKEII